jgi:hypothetical protein
VSYISELTQHSRAIEIQLILFRSFAKVFADEKNSAMLVDLIENFKILGTVLHEELNYDTNKVSEVVETTVEYDSKTKQYVFNTALNKPKFSKYYNPVASHVIVSARLKHEGKTYGPLPFFMRLRDPKTGELTPGIKMKWLGPSIGYRQGREFTLEFSNVRVDYDKQVLNRCVFVKNDKLEIFHPEQWHYFFRLCFLFQQAHDIYRNIKEAMKVSFLAIKWTQMRTQFKTLEEKGKERKIFEYNFNKTRIMKAICETLNMYLGMNIFKRIIKENMSKPSKNKDQFSELFVIMDAFEIYVHERCAENVETLRESTGGMGYLKFSGIPNYFENVIRNSVYNTTDKTTRFMKLAAWLANSDYKSGFIKTVLPYINEHHEKFPTAKLQVVDDFKRIDHLCWLGARKIIWRSSLIKKEDLLNPNKELIGKTLEEPMQLATDFLEYLISFAGYREIFTNPGRTNNKTIGLLCLAGGLQHLQSDARFLLANSSILKPNFHDEIKTTLAWVYETLGAVSNDIVDSFLYDTKLLNSSFRDTIEQTYEEVFYNAKHRNPRNDPKLHDEIRKELVDYINRPEDPKL